MEQIALFEEKVYLTPRDMNRIGAQPIDAILLSHLKEKLENKCSQHGFVLPNSLDILSRSMGQLENGKYTGNIIFHVQVQGRVYNPANGTRIVGRFLKKNKMGIYMIHKNAIRILIPRDLHIGNEEFENLQPQDVIEVEIRKSRFQMNDKYILSVGVFIGKFDPTANQIEDQKPAMPPPAPIADEEPNTESEDKPAEGAEDDLLDDI